MHVDEDYDGMLWKNCDKMVKKDEKGALESKMAHM